MEHTFEQPSTDQQLPTPRQAATTSQLMTRIGDLEKQLKETKQTFGKAILTLVDSVGKIDCNILNTGSITVKSSSNTRVSTSHSDEESNMKMHQLLVAAPKQTTTVLPQTISISNIKLHNSEKEEYDYMGYGDGEHYLEYIDNEVWKALAEIQAVEKERRQRISVADGPIPKDPKFTSRFWKGLQKAWGTRLKFSTAFHPQTDGQSERTIQTLEDMLRACALEWTGSWDEYLCLVEFAYNNSWHASIKAAPFELLYGRKCRAPICWDEVGERLIEGPELIEITNEKVAVAKEKLKEARSRQKSYADKHRRDLEFQVGDRVFLKVSPFRGVKRFGIKGKLSPRFIGPFEILERIGEVSYRLALPPQLSHVHDVFHVSLLRGYHYHPLHVASYPFDQIQPDMSLSEEPESILDRQERVMRNKVIPFVKILWKNHPEREATWETEESMRASYPHFFV
ncbi:putative nucleotidyltransferase, ribonuclease H [Tanacetum coccineum]|uniref:Nucleotidyltransferase, ribonuclease H n=1 Tax=Tanacetum coccineum TaxID=301880 RepID=A0ABQ5DAZ1_9ASTR